MVGQDSELHLYKEYDWLSLFRNPSKLKKLLGLGGKKKDDAKKADSDNSSTAEGTDPKSKGGDEQVNAGAISNLNY